MDIVAGMMKNFTVEEFFYEVVLDRHPLRPYSLDANQNVRSTERYKKNDKVTIFDAHMKSLENGKIILVWDNRKHADNEYYKEARMTRSLIVDEMTDELKSSVRYDTRYNNSGTLDYPLHPDRLKNIKINL